MSPALPIALALLLQAPAATPEGWVTFRSPKAGFSAIFPARPTERTQRLKLGDQSLPLRVTAVKRGSTSYSIETATLPSTPDDPAASLDAARDELAGRLKGEVIEDEPAEVAGQPGRRVTIEIPKTASAGGSLVRARLLVAGDRLVELVTVHRSYEAKRTAPEVDAFFAGLALMDAPAVATPARSRNTAPKDGWQDFTSDAGRYSVRLPARPTLSRQSAPVPRGGLAEVHSATAITAAGQVFSVLYNDYPRDRAPDEDLAAVYDGMRDAAVAKMPGAKLVSDEEIKVGPLPGREVGLEIRSPLGVGSSRARIRYVLAGLRLYQLMHLAPATAAVAADADAFFHSFKILGDVPVPPRQVRINPPSAGADEYVARAWNFAARFPKTPQVREGSGVVPGGRGRGALFSARDGSTTYEVMIEEWPAGQFAAFATVPDAAVAKGSTVDRAVVKMGNLNGREYAFEPAGSRAGFARIRSFVDVRRAYTIRYSEDRKGASGGRGDAFLDSFRQLDPAP